MKQDEYINNIIVSDGENEYEGDDIFKNKELYSFVNRNILKAPVSLFEEVIIEKGTIYIETDKKLETCTFSLKNVSPELYDKFWNRYK